MQYKLLVFDMDGTFTHSDMFYYRTLKKMYKKHFFELSDEDIVRGTRSTAKATLLALGTGNLNINDALNIFEDYFKGEGREEIKNIPVHPSIFTALKKSKEKGYMTALLTNSTAPVTDGVIEFNHMEGLFDAVSSASIEIHEKDKRILPLIESFGVSLDEVVCIGDAEFDFEMCNKFCIDGCFVDNDFSWYKDKQYIMEELKPKYIIHDLAEIPEIFEA